MLARRSFIGGLISAMCAPAIVRASSLMPVRTPALVTVSLRDSLRLTLDEIVTVTLRNRSSRIAENLLENNAFFGRSAHQWGATA